MICRVDFRTLRFHLITNKGLVKFSSISQALSEVRNPRAPHVSAIMAPSLLSTLNSPHRRNEEKEGSLFRRWQIIKSSPCSPVSLLTNNKKIISISRSCPPSHHAPSCYCFISDPRTLFFTFLSFPSLPFPSFLDSPSPSLHLPAPLLGAHFNFQYRFLSPLPTKKKVNYN